MGLESLPTEVTIIILDIPEQPVLVESDGALKVENINSAHTYHWMRNNEIVNDKELESFIPNTNGNYYLKVSNADGCSAQSETILYKLEDHFVLDVYPNPSNGSFYVRSKFFPFKSMDISIKNMSDKLYYTDSIYDPNRSEQIAITLGNAPNGVYIMNLNNQYFKKIIITNR